MLKKKLLSPKTPGVASPRILSPPPVWCVVAPDDPWLHEAGGAQTKTTIGPPNWNPFFPRPQPRCEGDEAGHALKQRFAPPRGPTGLTPTQPPNPCAFILAHRSGLDYTPARQPLAGHARPVSGRPGESPWVFFVNRGGVSPPSHLKPALVPRPQSPPPGRFFLPLAGAALKATDRAGAPPLPLQPRTDPAPPARSGPFFFVQREGGPPGVSAPGA